MSDQIVKTGSGTWKIHVETQGSEVLLVIGNNDGHLPLPLTPELAIQIGNALCVAGIDAKNFLECVKKVKGFDGPEPVIRQPMRLGNHWHLYT